MANSDVRDFLRKAKRAGLVVERTGSDHWLITNPAQPGPRVICSSTTDDCRAMKNTAAQVRRLLGVDLRR